MGSHPCPAAPPRVTDARPTSGDHREAAVTIRPMHRDDVPTIVAIEQHSFSDPWSALTFRSALTRPHTRASAAVDLDGRPCGYCVLLHVLDEGEIANIAVDPARRGRGIAGRLLDDALAAAVQLELSRVFLEVRESNTAARALYVSRGFRPVGRRSGYYQRPDEDALVLQWTAPV